MLLNFINGICSSIKNHFAIQQSISELNMFSDRELHDIGISRGDIPYISMCTNRKYSI